VWVTLRQVRTSHDQLKLSEQGQFTDRYTKAIDQLDDKNALAVRLGGLYALERIARDSPTDRATIAEVLSAYVRTAPRPPVADSIPTTNPPRFTLRAPDVQAALAILGRWRERLGEPPPVLALHNADLRGADLVGAQLQDADLGGAQLQGAILYSAQLQGATLIGTQLQSAWLVDAELQGARLVGAQLQGAWLIRAQLQDVNLVGAELQDAKLDSAQLQGADLNAAQLREADLTGAQLQGARCSASTVWPDGFDWKAAGVQLQEDD
jgi:Pentapeptide repeats (8 copies)